MFFSNKIHLSYFIFLFFISSFTFSHSQSSETYFHELEIQGIPLNKKINTLFVDSIGYLWIGTDSGLYRYDGNDLISYQHDVFNPDSLPNNGVNSIVEDDNNNLWIGSESYLIHFNRKENKFKGYYKNITVSVIHKSSNGDVWANIRNTGLVKIIPGKYVDEVKFDTHFNYTKKSNLTSSGRQINSFVEDNFGRRWLATPKGVFVLNIKNEYIATNLKQNIKSLKILENNKLVALTNNELLILGYNKKDDTLEVLERHNNFIPAYLVKAKTTSLTICKDKNIIWIGTTRGLIKAIRSNNSYDFTYFAHKDINGSLNHNHITSTTFDEFGNLWIGSLKGVNKYTDRTSIFNFNGIKTNNDNAVVRSILHYSPNTILVGMFDGLSRYNPLTKEFNKIKTGIKNITLILQNFEKDKLLIVSNNKLYLTDTFKQGKKELQLTEIANFKNRINDIALINKNEIWVGLWNDGVKVINSTNNITTFKKDVINTLANNHTSSLLFSKTNELWVGTRGEGLFRIDFTNESLEEYLPSSKNGLSSNAILNLHEDVRENIWIGTRGGGLNKYIRKSNVFTHYNKNKGLLYNTISAIEEDYNENLWLSTPDGLVRFNTKDEKFRHFGIEDGIKEIQFANKSNTSDKEQKKIYFGSYGGFYTIITDEFYQKSTTPSTVITSFKTLGVTKNNETKATTPASTTFKTDTDTPIILPHNQNNIAINFSSLDLTHPLKNQYAYMLEGLTNYWINTVGHDTKVNYNDLPPGDYSFKIKSSNSDGVWNETPTELKFTIQPPFWLSKWAYLTYFIFTLILIYVGIKLIRRWYRLKENLVKETVSREKDNEHNRMKMVFFTDISHELRTPLSLIFGTVEKAIKEKNFTLSPVTIQRIHNNTLRMRRLINQIMDIRKFDGGEFKLRISKNDIVKDIEIIKNAFNDFARIYNINYSFITEETKVKGWYDVDILEKILFNLLSNAFKHTPEHGKINVKLELITIIQKNPKELNLEKGTYAKCSVQDNGIGISADDLPFIFNRYYQATNQPKNHVPGTGIGMELVQKLIERHHGSISVESKPNTFTNFIFYLPIDKKRYSKSERLEMAEPLKRNFIKNSEFQVIEEVSLAHDAKTKPKTDKPKVLIVEDNRDLREMIKEELKKDFSIKEASDGKKGYEAALKERPQLIISDILMPIEDGISMLKKIKANPELNSIPIFMLTAKNSDETKIECLSLGADDYIEKPFSLEFVKWKVKNTFISRGQLKKQYSKVITAAPSQIVADSNSEKFIRKLVTIIEDSMNDNLLSVEYLASEVGMSRANLYRKLQAISNVTPVNFIKKIRLKRAEQLLKDSDLYLSEIAYMTGFNNQKYFGKCFQKEYGMSPTQYIKKYKNLD